MSILESVPEDDNTSPFSIHITKTDKYLKSNLYPIIFPKELFQFEIEYKEDERPWALLRELTKDQKYYSCSIQAKGICFIYRFCH